MSDSDTSRLIKGSLLGRIGLNVRGVVVVLLCFTVCLLTALKIEVQQELYWLTSAAVTYYFGQQHRSENPST